MRLDQLARDYLARARSRRAAASTALRRREYPDVVRYSQECVEFSLKAVLRLVGVDYPKQHDVGDVLVEVKAKFPAWFREQVEHLAIISTKLALQRGPSTYGEEERGIPPSKLFGPDEAKTAFNEAQGVCSQCARLLKAASATE